MGYMQTLQQCSKDALINELYNTRVAGLADDNDTKRIPYIGWFWRHTDFVGKHILIGNAGSFIGVMENNKWDYPERMMTEAEVDTFIAFLDRAFEENRQSGLLDEIIRKTAAVLKECWDWFQTLQV